MNAAPAVFICVSTPEGSGPSKTLLELLGAERRALARSIVATFEVAGGRSVAWLRRGAEGSGVRFAAIRQRFAWDPSALAAAYRLVRRERIEVLESHEYKSHLVCFLLKLATGLPWAAFAHGWTSENRRIGVYTAVDRALLRFADAVVVVSESMRHHPNLKGVPRGRIEVIPNAVGAARDTGKPSAGLREKLGIGAAAPVVGVVGRLSPEKGHAVFLEAFRALAGRFPDARAVLLGSGPEERALRRLAKDLGIDDRVVFAGFSDDVASYYRMFDVLACPSLSEGMPNAVLEAMFFSTPVVASRVGGVPELVRHGETGTLVEPGSASALAAGIEAALRDAEATARMTRRANERVLAEFTAARRNEKVLDLYRRLAAANPRRAAV